MCKQIYIKTKSPANVQNIFKIEQHCDHILWNFLEYYIITNNK